MSSMEAIVLRRFDIKEHDQIISLLTKEEGRLDLISRSVKKITSKNAAHLEPCCFVSIDIAKGKDMDLLVRAVPINIFVGMRTDMYKSYVAQYLALLVTNISKQNDQSEQLFETLLRSLYLLEIATHPFALLNILLIDIISAVGFAPLFDRCAVCGENNKQEQVFVVEKGGICCISCIYQGEIYKKYTISQKQKQIFQHIIDKKYDILQNPEERIELVHDMILAYTRYHLDLVIPDWVI